MITIHVPRIFVVLQQDVIIPSQHLLQQDLQQIITAIDGLVLILKDSLFQMWELVYVHKDQIYVSSIIATVQLEILEDWQDLV